LPQQIDRSRTEQQELPGQFTLMDAFVDEAAQNLEHKPGTRCTSSRMTSLPRWAAR